MLLRLSLFLKIDDEELLSHIVSHRLCKITLRLIFGKTFLNALIDGSGIPYLYANSSRVMSLRAYRSPLTFLCHCSSLKDYWLLTFEDLKLGAEKRAFCSDFLCPI